jgi:hypothetical protein
MDAKQTCLTAGHQPKHGFGVTMCMRCGVKLNETKNLVDELRLAGVTGTTLTIQGRHAALISGLLDLLVAAQYSKSDRVIIESRVQELLKEIL